MSHHQKKILDQISDKAHVFERQTKTIKNFASDAIRWQEKEFVLRTMKGWIKLYTDGFWMHDRKSFRANGQILYEGARPFTLPFGLTEYHRDGFAP
jgi:hypothetical protein